LKVDTTLVEKSFIPSQPEIGYHTENYIELKPISKNIALFYQFKIKEGSPNSFSILPDGCFDIVFCCSSIKPFAILWASPLERTMQPFLPGGCQYFGARFFPEQRVIQLNYSMRELLGKIIPLVDIMSIDSSIVEKIGAGKSFVERIKIFEKFIDSNISEFNYDQNIVEYSIKKIYSRKGNISIKQLSEDTGYSDRYLRNKFEKIIGFSPKQFSEVVKFQNSLGMILKTENSNLLDIVHENGYHDQSHFIKRFKEFTHFTPIQFKKNIS
jgi:AraC-like DNA-binding protein